MLDGVAKPQVGIGGNLRGAAGVDVGGMFFDVTFMAVPCVSVFDRCDVLADFRFGNRWLRLNPAHEALYEQAVRLQSANTVSSAA